MFDKLNCIVLEYQKLHDLPQIKIFYIFATFALDRSWNYSMQLIYTNGDFFCPAEFR